MALEPLLARLEEVASRLEGAASTIAAGGAGNEGAAPAPARAAAAEGGERLVGGWDALLGGEAAAVQAASKVVGGGCEESTAVLIKVGGARREAAPPGRVKAGPGGATPRRLLAEVADADANVTAGARCAPARALVGLRAVGVVHAKCPCPTQPFTLLAHPVPRRCC